MSIAIYDQHFGGSYQTVSHCNACNQATGGRCAAHSFVPLLYFPCAGDTATPATVNYGTRTCPTCSGTGINPVLPVNLCPKCNGEKRVAA